MTLTLEVLREQVKNCVRCKLSETRTQTVFGDGNPKAKLMIVGEGPGANEDKQGLPFVGEAGKLLTNILGACSIRREDVFIANTVKCRPPGNRTPELQEVESCSEYLKGQIAAINPKYMLLLGAVATVSILGMPMNLVRGQLTTQGKRYIISTYHPAYLLRNPAAKKDVWNDLQPLLELMRKEGDL